MYLDLREAAGREVDLLTHYPDSIYSRLFMNSINSAVEQLRYAGLIVDVRQADRDDGVDISISVTRPQQQ